VFRTLLVANRGEIALRIVRACRERGIRSVAVYSDADRTSPHVLAADHAVRLGPAPSGESYLRIDRLLEAARASGAEAIHPGYGFLAERAEFAQAVTDAGLIFVGPSASAISAMGDKTAARRRMQAAGVPIVPGVVDPIADPTEALRLADEIGYPVLLKAAAGGGGKGMRVVEAPEQLPRAFEAAAREALAAFGDGSVYLERYLARPRHVEIQILADGHGTTLHLGERECSIQRRHQKLVEEAPSPAMTPELRAAMGDAAVRAAQAVDYVGAGTVELLLQGDEFFFLEMNTRLQVEHPVTELVTGLDIVHWQLRIAAGEALPFTQDDIRLTGHSIECRITAEDSARGFLPATGVITDLHLPAGPGVRWDGGIAPGYEVGLHYDSLLGKLIVHAPTRDEAVARMRRALDEFRLSGLPTSAPFHRSLMDHPVFRSGELSIRFLEEYPEVASDRPSPEALQAAAVAAALLEHEARRVRAAPRIQGQGSELPAWRRNGAPWGTG